MIGLTSPASLFSTVVQINAEVLSAVVIFQTARPGWPVIYGAASRAADANTDLVDEIKEEGPGGAFLAHRSTLRNFRDKDEIYTSPYYPSKLRGTIHEKADSIAIANKLVREILEGPIEDELPGDVVAANRQDLRGSGRRRRYRFISSKRAE